MSNYILGNQDPRTTYEALLMAKSMEFLFGLNENYEVEGKSTHGLPLMIACDYETGGHLNVKEFKDDGDISRELDLRGIISSLQPEILDGPRTTIGVVSFTPRPSSLLEIFRGVKSKEPTTKQINQEVKRLIGEVGIVMADLVIKKDNLIKDLK